MAETEDLEVTLVDARTAVEEVGRWASSFSLDEHGSGLDVPVRRSLFDGLSVTIAGARLPENRAWRTALPTGTGESTVLGDLQTAGALDAAWCNGMAMVALELDEGNQRSGGHPTVHCMPAALALAERQRSSGRQFVESLVVGYEVASRFGSATTRRPEVHPHGHWGATGAAAACARLMGLGPDATAVAIDASCALGLATPFEVVLRGLPIRNAWTGAANTAGIQAAAAAAAALEPVGGIAELSLGTLLGTFDPSVVTERLGERLFWHEGYFKRHASCSYTHPAADVVLELCASRTPVEASDVDEILVEIHHLAAGLTKQVWPTRLAAMFSIPYVVAAALRWGSLEPERFDERHRADAELAALAGKVVVRHDRQLDFRLPNERATRVTLAWSDGSTSCGDAPNPVGHSWYRPLGDDDLLAKAARILSEQEACGVLALVDRLIVADDVRGPMSELRQLAASGRAR